MEPAVPCGAGPFGGPRGLAVGAAPPVGRLQLGGLRRRRPSEIRQKLAAGGWVSGYVTRCVASSSLLEQLHFSLLAFSQCIGDDATLSITVREEGKRDLLSAAGPS
ncbi:unnamed protein product [Gadus morhua 'NCC']